MGASDVVIRANRIPGLQKEILMRAGQAVVKAALDIEANAKTIVPVDTGNLKNSIQTAPEGTSGLVMTVGPRSVEYAVYIEFGTWKMRAQPYLIPSAEKVRPSFMAAMSQICKV